MRAWDHRPVTAPRERSWWYAALLLVLAPFVAETVASSNTPVVVFPVVLPLYLVVYGCPALLLRELWVRGRIRMPRLLLFGLAYTAFNEGVVAATWFKLAPATGKVLVFTAAQAGHVAGVNWAVAVNLVVFHTVFSLMAPITVVQGLAAARGRGADRRPWVGRPGAIACIVLIVLVLVGSLTPQATQRVCAGPASATCTSGRAGAAALIVVIAVLVAFLPVARPTAAAPDDVATRLDRGQSEKGRWRAVRLIAAGCAFGIAFLLSFFGLPLFGQPTLAVVTGLLLLVPVALVGAPWCRLQRHRERGDLLLVLGALLPGMALSFAAWRVGQPVAALIAAALMVFLIRRLSQPDAASGSTDRRP